MAPALHPRLHVIPMGDSLLLRRGNATLQLDPPHVDFARTVLASLADPSAPAPRPLAAAVRMIDELDRAGLLTTTEETWVEPPQLQLPCDAPPWRVAIQGGGPAARAAAGLLGPMVAGEDGAEIVVVCPDGPDLEWLLKVQRQTALPTLF